MWCGDSFLFSVFFGVSHEWNSTVLLILNTGDGRDGKDGRNGRNEVSQQNGTLIMLLGKLNNVNRVSPKRHNNGFIWHRARPAVQPPEQQWTAAEGPLRQTALGTPEARRAANRWGTLGDSYRIGTCSIVISELYKCSNQSSLTQILRWLSLTIICEYPSLLDPFCFVWLQLRWLISDTLLFSSLLFSSLLFSLQPSSVSLFFIPFLKRLLFHFFLIFLFIPIDFVWMTDYLQGIRNKTFHFFFLHSLLRQVYIYIISLIS